MLTVPFWTALSFVLGALPFSVWLARLAGADARRYGDGNPGAANAWRAGGWKIGLPALLLDVLKGAVPVGVANLSGAVTGWGLVPVALAPVLGHAFSPFLRFRGGKALAPTFGVWTGLLPGDGPTILGTFLGLFYLLQTNDSWAVILALLAFPLYLLVRGVDQPLLAIWAGNLLIALWKHRHDLRRSASLRPWLQKLLRPER